MWKTLPEDIYLLRRIGKKEVQDLEIALGPFAAAGQLQQSPQIRGGNIFKEEWWNDWDPKDGKFPTMEYVIASVDPAYTEQEENSPSGFSVWGVFNINSHGHKGIMLMNAWEKWLEIRGPEVPRLPGETHKEYVVRASPKWGLVEWCAHSCQRFKVDLLLVEAKASGLSLAQELRLQYKNESWGIKLINPKSGDKVARAYSVQPIFSQGMIWAPVYTADKPHRAWVQRMKERMSAFPKTEYPDLVDSATQALRFLRECGFAPSREEQSHIAREEAMHSPPPQPLYPI